MVKAKKAAVKKGKYFQIFSQGTQPLKIKPVGAGRLGHCLQAHGFDMVGKQPALSGHGPEVW